MPTLTRRRYPERPDCWHVYYGDVHVGTIARRIGNPHDTDTWEWNCGFYPGSHPREHKSDTAATFEQARADFERAWAAFLPNRSVADFQAWRDQQAWTAEKHRRFDRGERMPPDWARSALPGCIMADWTRKFNEPIPVPKGRRLVTLRDAGDYVAKLPKAKHMTAEWQAAMLALMLVVDLNGPTMMARIGIMRALNRGYVREFDSSRKDTHWGKRKLKRDA
jgi:hypothetical protein